jgi:hypothetical protein
MTKNNEENIQPERIKKIKEEALNLVKEVNEATLKKKPLSRNTNNDLSTVFRTKFYAIFCIFSYSTGDK